MLKPNFDLNKKKKLLGKTTEKKNVMIMWHKIHRWVFNLPTIFIYFKWCFLKLF